MVVFFVDSVSGFFLEFDHFCHILFSSETAKEPHDCFGGVLYSFFFCLQRENLWLSPGKINFLPWKTPAKLLEFFFIITQ